MDLPDLPAGVRPATTYDVAPILRLVRALARHVDAEDQVLTTEEQLHEALFGPAPAARALVAEHEDEEGNGADVVGFALYYLTFSTWVGRPGIHLEDLFVSPGHRGTGLGHGLMVALARIATHHDLGRLEWDCLETNTPSRRFYERLGARVVPGSVEYRLTGEGLGTLARQAGQPASS